MNSMFGWIREKIGFEAPKDLIALGAVELTEPGALDQVLAESEQKPVFFFKHSTRCPISSAAYQRVADYLAEGNAGKVYLVKVIEARPLSNAIAERLNVKHESPQVILVHRGKAVWHASHGDIDAPALRTAYEQATTR
jgi:bacillithiol system protein YtxJ